VGVIAANGFAAERLPFPGSEPFPTLWQNA